MDIVNEVTSNRLETLRKLLDEHSFDGYIVPTNDDYLSEYTPEYAKRLEFITGFTGSNGLAIILKNTVLFFTDGRYINQAFVEMDDHIFEIFDLQMLWKFNWSDYVTDNQTIFYDPQLFTNRSLMQLGNLRIKPYANNLIDSIWKEQPKKPSSEIYDNHLEYAGETYQDKIKKTREILANQNAQNLVITDSDSICWLLNIRAHDVEFTPLLLAHAIVTVDHVYLFTDKNRFSQSLSRPEIVVFPQDEFAGSLDQLEGVTIFDENQASSYISEIIKSKEHRKIQNPIMLWKACKNDVEINCAHQAHIQDAVAVCEILSFIANNNVSDLSEYDIGKKLTSLRSLGKDYVFDSFPTISGYRENGAIIHYRAEETSSKKLEGEGMLLIDSGGQYNGATTDITRVALIGKASDKHKKYYTKVLKGHIALASATFPENRVTGAHLDILARQYLWEDGADYAHGTGHGVGSFLSVHEGPQNISLLGFASQLKKGMILSNEPGYYVDGEFGIRIENLMYVKESDKKGFLNFENLTLVPYEKDLIDIDQLEKNELKYIKSYYKKIEEKIFPLLSNHAKKWAQEQISPFKPTN